jgi:hypothetical protein
MGNYINIYAGALFIMWIVGYFEYKAGENIHIFLFSSIILVLGKAFILDPIIAYTPPVKKPVIVNL